MFYNVFTNGPDALGGVMLDAVGADDADDMSSAVGTFFDTGIETAGRAAATDGWFMPYLLWLLIALGVFLFTAIALALIVLGKITMAIVLSLAPIFLIFLLFEPTKQMFASWLNQLFNAFFTIVLVYLVLGFFIGIMDTSICLIPLEDMNVGHCVPVALVGIVAGYVLVQIPGVASGLAGGVQVSTIGAFSSMGRSASRGLSGSGRAAAGAGAKGIKAVYQRIRGGASKPSTNNSIRK